MLEVPHETIVTPVVWLQFNFYGPALLNPQISRK